MEDNSHYLTSYKQFFSRFSSSVDLSDQLPVKVAGYNLSEFEIVGAVTDWCLQYLNQRRCPSSLIAPLIQKVVKEVHQTCSIETKEYRSKETGDFLPLQLMHLTMRKLVQVCCQYNDNAMLSTLPPPYSGLLAPKVSSCAIKNSRRSMEDRHVVLQDLHVLFNIKDCGSASYYAVFDGHNGLDAAVYGVSHLHQFLAESQYYPTDPVLAFRDAFQKTDDQFIQKSGKENLRSGTTAVCALLRPKESMLYIAWLGDSQAVIVKQGCPTQIVKPHKPDREDERERIEGMGGSVLFWGTWRVNGQLAVSRAIGDLEYKPYVSAEPDVKAIPLDGTEDFLILACDGLWDFVSEQEAVNAVYNQLNISSDDLEGVSQRLVSLSKDQGSSDNISVVVVFLAEPSEVTRRRHMETASPNPFLKQNGSELFCGTPTNGKLHPCSGSFHDEDDFGPETDVDMVDDVLLSPTIAAAKKLVSEKSEFENDLERQRHQMSDFDDPADFGRSRDTPTPPAHEVVGNVDDTIAAESGEGEESEEEEEEEWNYFCGSTQNNKNTSVNTELEDSDMMSQLNPDAAEFVPVSPSRFMMDPDPVISSSPMHGHEKSLDNVALPSQVEFNLDIAHRPGQLDSSGTESQFWSESGTGNENTQLAKSEEISTNAEYGDSSTLSFEASANNSTDQMLGKLSCDVTHNELDLFDNKNTEYVNTFGSQNMNSFKDLAIYPNTEVKSLHQPTDVDSDLKVYCLPQEPDDSIVPDTPKSTAVEAPVSPIDMQTDIDSPDENQHNQKSPELISPSDGHLEGLSAQEPTSSSGFESESGADEPETHISDDLKLSEGDGFTIEHRRSPPVQPVHFKPIDTFSDTNPFDVLDNLTSPSTEKETPLIQPSAGTLNIGVDSLREIHTELQNPKDNFEIETHLHENLFSSLPTEQYNANEKYQETLTSILNESQGIDEFKQLEKNIPKDDNLLTGQFEFKSDMAKTEQTSLFSGSNTCSFQSKDTELDTSEPTESKVVPSIEPSEAEGEAKLKGNIFNTITGLEFETSKQEFDDKVSDIIFGSRDSELAFDSGKSCEMETVINSSEHQIHNFEEVQFDTSKSNKLESKYLDIHFGTDDIEFDTDYNDYGISNKNVENSLPCKEETEIKTIDEERKLVDNVVKNEKDVENETTQTNINIDGDSIECSNIMKNVEVTQSIDDGLSSAKELVEVSVSSANEQLVNTSENLLTELHEDQIVDSKVMSAYDFDKFPEYDFDNLSDKFLPVQDVQGEIVTERHENNEANKLDKESSKDVVLDEIGNEISNVETEIFSDVKEVEANTIPFIQSEFTHSPLNVITSDKVEEPISFKTETNNSIHLDEIKDVRFETPLIAELGQSVVPQTENEAMSEILNNETLAVTDEPCKTICQNESCVVEDKSDDLKENEKLVEVETNIIPTATAEDVAVEIKESSEFCKFNTTTEVQELSVSESQMPKPPHFEDTTSTVSEVVIPTLNETCIMPVTELDLPEVSSDKDLKRENETQLLLQSETTETLQTEETGEMLTVTETPPPTPSPGIVEEEGRKEGLLAVAAAAAAAAGVATVAGAVGSDSKQAPKKLAATSKKPATSASKKPLDSGTKTAVKPPLKTTVSPSKPATSKPSPQTVATKKPTITGVSKTTKPATSDVKTTPTSLKPAPSKPSTPTSRTTTTTSKPTTSHSKPSTPTSRPVSASKSDIAKSPLTKPALPAKTTAAKPAKPAASTVKVTEKKPLTNGEVLKPAVKKVDHSETKKLPLSAASKPATTVGRPASVAPVKSTATKVSTTTVKSSMAAKTPAAAPIQSKPTPPVSNSVKQSTKANTSTLVAKNRPPSASTLKPTDKTGKDSVNKQISSVKTSTASKVSPGNKTSLKTESKVSSKIDSAKLNKSSKDQVKKPVGTKKLESTQEHTITTTNGYTDIIEIEVKKEELSHGDSNQEAVQALE